jgi:hypothetical protein
MVKTKVKYPINHTLHNAVLITYAEESLLEKLINAVKMKSRIVGVEYTFNKT